MSVASQRLMDNITYEDLYHRWEQGNWSAYDLDFSQDRAGWEALSDIQRRSAMWIYSMFYYGEDRVADTLAPYVTAAPTEEMSYFLATQQVDEVRHSIFFHRFFKEVIGVGGDSIQQTLSSTLPQLNWGYRGIFDRLDVMAEELRKDRSVAKFCQAITLYHLIVEGSLAQPGQHFIEDFFASEETMPGFTAGMENVSRDEQRHIGFGVKVLSELLNEPTPGWQENRDAVIELLREVLPYGPGRLLAAEHGPLLHRVLRLLARGHLRLRDETDPPALADDRLPDRGVAPRRLPLPARRRREGPRRAPGEDDDGRRDRLPGRAAAEQGPRDPAPLLRPDQPRRRPGRRQRLAASSSSGASPTPNRGTWSSTTARPAPSPAKRRTPTSRSRPAGPTGSPPANPTPIS